MRFLSLLLGAVALGSVACSRKIVTPESSVGLGSRLDSVAYAFGVLNGDGFRRNVTKLPGDSLSQAQVLAGFTASYTGRESLLSSERARQIFQDYIKELQDKEDAELRHKNDSVLAVNKTRPGVQVTERGLQYRILREGIGVRPSSVRDTVIVHYVGKLIDGTEFDSSYKRKVPATLQLDQVIAGWTEGLMLMNTGAQYEFYIPAQLAYGEDGVGEAIPAHATLIFEIELLDVKPHQEPKVETSIGTKPDEQKTKTQATPRRGIGKNNPQK